MERFIYPLYSVYQGYGGTLMSSQGGGLVGPKQKQLKWKQSKGRSPSLGVPITPATAAGPEPADYLDGYMWAQLKALLSQVSPGLPLRLCKANTKDLGVQVNPGWMPQCSAKWGPAHCRAASRRAPQTPSAVPQGEGAAEMKRSTFQVGQASSVPSHAAQPPPWCQVPALWQSPPSSRCTIPPTEASPGRELLPQWLQFRSRRKSRCQVITKLSLLQFLEQKYGYFHCKDSKTRWESVYVWYISGSNRVYFKQLCHKSIQCQTCSKTQLCGHCKGKRLFCDNTYSFKYIV
uniref:Zygote arrest 1 like n=1 Tax=Chelonoidis abingdonii TaxID=106734 RepID=A0A8C0IQ25_CHEAB